MTAIRITLSQHRLAILSGFLALIALAAACLVVAWRLESISVPASCGTDWLGSGPPIPMPGQELTACQRAEQAFFNQDFGEASNLLFPLILLPMVVGLTTGAGLVSSEIEEGTSQLAWWLAISRARWFFGRVIPPAMIFCIALLIGALAADRLAAARMPGQDPAQSFEFYAMRGWTFVGRGLAAYAFAVAIGAVVGRSLPALILAGILTVPLLIAGAALIREVWLPAQATLVEDPAAVLSPANLVLGVYARFPDGHLEPTTLRGVSSVNGSPHEPVTLPDGSVLVTKMVGGEQYRTTDLIEGGLWIAIAASVLGAGNAFISRRRPI